VTLEAFVTLSLVRAREILRQRGTFVRRIADSCTAQRTVRAKESRLVELEVLNDVFDIRVLTRDSTLRHAR
jgi:hypothetical protein